MATVCSPEQIKTNTCKVDINNMLCIKWACKPWYDAANANRADILVQDVFLTGTMLIGTIVTLVLVVSWVQFVMAWGQMAEASKAKTNIKNALIWLVIVTFSYTIVRLIQYIVAWYN